MIFDMLITGAGGFLGHFGRFVTENMLKLRRGWLDLAHYAMGVTFVLPFGLLISDRIIDVVKLPDYKRKNDVRRWFKTIYTIVYFVSFVSFGIGNVCAWLAVTYFDKNHR